MITYLLVNLLILYLILRFGYKEFGGWGIALLSLVFIASIIYHLTKDRVYIKPEKKKKPQPAPIQSRVKRNTPNTKFELPDRKDYSDSAAIGMILASKSILIGGTKWRDVFDMVDNIISHIVLNKLPEEAQIILIEDDKSDQQASALAPHRMLPHVHVYAGTPEEAEREIKALRKDIDRLMGTADDRHVIYIITNLHNKMYAQYKEEFEYWQENGPAAGFKLISLIQKPTAKEMAESTVLGFETRIALRCRSAKQISFIMQKDFAECRPKKHKVLITRYNTAPYEYEVRHRSAREIEKLTDFWCKQGRSEAYIMEKRLQEIHEAIEDYKSYARFCRDAIELKNSEAYRRFVWAGEELKKLEGEVAAQERAFASSAGGATSFAKTASRNDEEDELEEDDFNDDLYPELSDIDKPKRKSKGYSIDEMVEMDTIFDDDF